VGPTGTEQPDASTGKRPRTLDTPAPTPSSTPASAPASAPAPAPAPALEGSGLLEAVVKRDPKQVEALLVGGAEVGDRSDL
jgi:hypothetical protein